MNAINVFICIVFSQYTGEFGLIDVSWRSVAVGAITSILVLPINFLVTLLFRRSKVSIWYSLQTSTPICTATFIRPQVYSLRFEVYS